MMLLSDRSAYTLVEALVVMEVRGVLVRVQSVTSVEHKCGNPGCVNPWHLELLTNEENAIRGNAARNGNGHTEEVPFWRMRCNAFAWIFVGG